MSDKLYHYTSTEAFLSIMENQELWLTDIKYLNDATEFEYTLMQAERMHRELISGAAATFVENVTNKVKRLALIDKRTAYVFSMSEEGDLLSQWRGYCAGPGGVSVGFSTSSLMEYCSNHYLPLRTCVYEVELQQSELLQLWRSLYMNLLGRNMEEVALMREEQVVSLLEQRRKELYDDDDVIKGEYVHCIMEFWSDVVMSAPINKHNAFAEEKEWRLVLGNEAEAHDTKVNYRPKSGYIVPYLKIKAPVECISEIILGPSAEPELARNSMRRFVEDHFETKVDVVTSNVPYRDL